jgi:two-component system phosphate regulon sensor histidine kinase PhoR
MAGETDIVHGETLPPKGPKSPDATMGTGEFINKIRSSETKERIWEVVSEYSGPVFGAVGIAVFECGDKGILSGFYGDLELESISRTITISMDLNNFVTRALSYGQPLNIPSLKESHIAGLGPFSGWIGSPVLAVPFGVGKYEGTLVLVRPEDWGDFSPADAIEIQPVAESLGRALQKISEGPSVPTEFQYVSDKLYPADVSDYKDSKTDPLMLAALARDQKERADELALLSEINKELLTNVDATAVLASLVTSIREAFGYFNVSVFLIHDDEPEKLVMTAVDGAYSNLWPPNFSLEISEGIIGHVALTGEYVVTNDAYHHQKFDAGYIDVPEKSECAFPLVIEERVIGILDIQQDSINAFDERKVQLFLALADQVALAVYKARLFEKQDRVAKEADILLNISSALGRSTDIDELLSYLATTTVSALRADGAAIVLTGEGSEFKNVRAAAGLPVEKKEALLSEGMKIDRTLIEQLEETSRPIVIEDTSASDIYGIKKMREFGAKSILLAPVKGKGELTGVIGAIWTSFKKRFDETDINLIDGIAVQTGVAIENVLYLEDLARQTRFLSVASAIAGEASLLPPVGVLLEKALSLILEYVGLERGIVFLYDQERFKRHSFRTLGLTEPVEASVIAYLRNEKPPTEIKNRVTVVKNVDKGAPLARAFSPGKRPAAYISVPFFAKRDYTGHIYLLSDGPLSISRYEIDSVQALSEQLSIFLENSLLFNQNVEQLAQMRTLLETSKQISSSLDPEEIIYNIAREVKNLIQAEECTVFLLNRNGGYLEPIVSLTAYPEEMLKVRLKVGEVITGNVALTGVGEYINDPVSDPRSKHVDGTPEGETESILCAPLISKEDVIGVMTLHRLAANPFTNYDLQLVTLFATQVAGLIENARMFDRVLSSMTVAEEQRQKLDAIFASVSEAFIVTDSNLRIIEINAAAEAFLKTSQEKVVNRYVHSVIDDKEIIEKLEDVVKNPARDTPIEFVYLRQEPETEFETYYRFTVDHLKDAEGDAVGLVISIIDVTGQIALEKMKDHFIANVSHELRTPLTSIIGSAELMLEDASVADSKFNRFVSIINKEAVRLRNLVDSILDFSLLEAGRFDLDLEPTSIDDICGEIVYRYKNVADDYGVSLGYKPSKDIGVVAVDRRLLDSIMSNLVKNGIHFNRRGGTVGISAYKDESDDGYLVIEVTDTGKGITAAQIDKMFSKFYQADDSSTRAVGGTGLGLSIVKKAAEAHGGHLEVSSEYGVGSVFTVYLPLVTP